MSVDCPITVQFEVKDTSILQELGRQHVVQMRLLAEGDEISDEFDRDALRMLEYVGDGNGVAVGPCGDLFTWGSVGNYSVADCFVDSLQSFWLELYVRHAMFDFHAVIVMFQQEQRPHGRIIEIVPERVAGQVPSTLVIRDQESSFPLFGWHLERPDALLPREVSTREVKEKRDV